MSRLDMDPRDRPPHVSPPSGPKRRAIAGTAAKAVAAALAAAVLAWGVRYGGDYLASPPAPPGPVPVIGPDAGPVKVVPENPGGTSVPDQDKVILNGDNAQPKVEQLLPPPETPLPSPAPPAPPQAAPQAAPAQPAAPAPAQAEAPPRPTSAPPQSASPAPAVASISPRPVPAPATAVTAPPPPKPAMAAASPPSPPAAAPLPPGQGYFLQLGALRSVEAAQQSWTRLKAAQPDILGSLPANAVRVDLGSGRGVYYRILAGPIADQSAATRSCNTLKQRHVACILVKP